MVLKGIKNEEFRLGCDLDITEEQKNKQKGMDSTVLEMSFKCYSFNLHV